MAGFKIELFKGVRPRISAVKLPIGEAVTAENCDLGSGDAQPFIDKLTAQAVGSGRSTRTIHLFDNNDDPIWLEWDDYVDVVRGPIKDDSLERTFYTGDTTGDGSPKMTSTDLVRGDPAAPDLTGPYPVDWVYMGVPQPTVAPTITTFGIAEDLDDQQRFVNSPETFSDAIIIDFVDFTVHPGTGTDNQTWRLNASATGTIELDINIGTSFRVASVINANRVSLESVSEPGVFARTAQSDKSSISNWYPMDEQGSTKKADFIGWVIPVGAEVQIIGHQLIVGDVITVTSIATGFGLGINLTTDLFEQNWDPEVLIEEGSFSFQRVYDGRVTPSSVEGDSRFQFGGSFFYDVDRTASAASELEDRQYVYTYVSNLGEEGPPSAVSAVTAVLDGQEVLVSAMALPPTIGFDIVKMRLYRTNSTEAGTEFQFVKEFLVARTARDSTLSADLGEVITSTTWDPPPTNMVGITEMPNGMLVGFAGKNIYFCEPYFPHAWPAEYDQAIGHNIVGLAAFGNSLAVLTEGHPYVLTASHPRNANLRPIKINQSCLVKESIATDSDRVYYASPDGLVEISVNGVKVATEKHIERKEWASFVPAKMVGNFHEGRYFGFYDFDVTAIDPVITAELSGTITSADESEIINGTETIIITLTNELWVAAGASFNAERAGIIAGLDAATNQTNGWNAELRDTELSVTDVVRTSDTVVTVTLPAAPNYAVVTDEVVTLTIPATALVISTAALVAASTFTITALSPNASCSVGGTIDTATEANIVSGGKTLTLTLTNDTWETAGATFDAQRQAIIDGLSASTNETGGWNDRVPNVISVTDVVRTSDSVVTITMPAIPLYDTTANETVTALVPHEALTTLVDVDLAALNSVAILTATASPSALFSGSIVGVTENELIAGGKQIVITLTNDTWAAAGTGPIGTTAESQALLDAILATTSQTLGWNNVIVPGIDLPADLVRTSATVATITLDAEATYSIGTSETIGMDIPAASLVTSVVPLTVSNTFGVVNQDPITCLLGGTVTASITELDVVAGGKTITLTLNSDTWLAAGTGPVGSTANSQAIIDGLVSAQSEGTGWDAVVVPGIDLPADLVRTSDTVVTITLDPEASYDITAQETITATVPAAAMNISAAPVVASPTFTVDEDIAASAAVTGTATATIGGADIVAGGKTIILTLSDDTWVASGAAFNAERAGIIAGLDSAQGEANGWNADVRDGTLSVTDVVRTSNTVVTITLPATVTYVTTAQETITVTIPATALDQSLVVVIGSPTFTVDEDIAATAALTGTITSAPEENDIVSGGRTIILTLTEDTWVASGATFNDQRQAIIDGLDAATSPANGWNDEVRDGTLIPGNVVRTSDTVVTVTLPATPNYDITATETITATIPAAALLESLIAVVASPTPTIIVDIVTTAVLTGTLDGANSEGDIIAGGKTIILTIADDTYIAAGASFDGVRQAIINGLDAAASPTNGWNNEVRDSALVVTDVVRTSDTVVTVTLSAAPNYDIISDEVITATIPASALVTSAIAVVATTTPTITTDIVSANTNNVSTSNDSPADAFAGVQYNSTGGEWSSTGGGTFSVGRGQWLDVGPSSAVWVERVINSGTLSWQDAGTGRLVLSTTRSYGVTDTTIGGGAVTANVTFNFYDAASGGNLLDSVTLDLTAEKTVGG